jgi:hypothetical protein
MHVCCELQKVGGEQGESGGQRSSGMHGELTARHLPFAFPGALQQRQDAPPFRLHLSSPLHTPLQACVSAEAAELNVGAT